jgi:uncharacterized membrane protein (DUF485 family)
VGAVNATPAELLASPELKRLIVRRSVVSAVMTLLLFIVHCGYILLIALNARIVTRRLGDGATTLGIPLGIAVIVLSWLLTAAYVIRANRVHDPGR